MIRRQIFFQEKIFLPILTTCELNTADFSTTVCFFKGPLGEWNYSIENTLNIKIISNHLYITSLQQETSIRCFMHASALRKIIDGLNTIFIKRLELRGLGYKVKMLNTGGIELALGYSHLISFKPPTVVDVRIIGNKSKIIEFRSNKELILSQSIAEVKNFRKRGVYKEKGIYEKNEKSVCKIGKKKKFS